MNNRIYVRNSGWKQCNDMIRFSKLQVLQVYKFIHNTVGKYVPTYTKLHTCTINKHTFQGQYRIKYLHKYRYKLT